MTRDSYVRFEGVWKRFRRGEVHDSLRDLLPALTRRLARRGNGAKPAELGADEFWALRDVSFEVRPGQALGIIGGNGAGKSTTLKVLTRILRPTSGRSEVRGRIGALIEISAGFHQDLTGRENVFLQGSIMGMPLEMIRRRFDQIVEFSGIADFLDTPVKRYSSGMQARLGFAIAAHLDPDVLIIDEVLAVGDFRYQDRAFGRIRELVASGIPVVIVSHQLDRIASLCTDAIVLEQGVVAQRGAPSDCIAWYLSGSRAALNEQALRSGIALGGLQVAGGAEVRSGAALTVRLDGEVTSADAEREDVVLNVRAAATGQLVYGTTLARAGVTLPASGRFGVEIRLDMNLRPGVYTLESLVRDRRTGQDLVAGPIAYSQVQDDPGFIGNTYLNPRVRLTPPGA